MPLVLVAFLFASFWIISTAKASGTTYYVDNVNGSDSFAGTQPAPYPNGCTVGVNCTNGPIKTIAHLNTMSFNPNDTIMFDKGDIWHEQLTLDSSGTSGNPITLSSYGTGASPIISGGNSMSGFTNGGSNIWDLTGVTTQPNVVIVNSGSPLVMSTSRAALTSPGQWYWTGSTLSVYATSNPSGHVDAGQRASAIDTNGMNYITITGLTLEEANTIYSGSGAGFYAHGAPNTIQVNGCTIINNAGAGIIIGGTSQSITVSNSTLSYNGGEGIYGNNVNNTNQVIDNNTITYNGWNAASGGGDGSGIESHIETGQIYGNIISYNGLAGPAGQQHGIYLMYQQNGAAQVYDNEFIGSTDGDGIKARGGATIYDNYISGNNDGVEVGGNAPYDATYSIYDNLILNGLNTGIYEDSMGTNNLYLSIYNNTLYYPGGSGNQAIELEDNITSLDIRNNLISIGNGSGHIFWIKVALTNTVKIDDNLYYDQTVDSTPFESVSTKMNLTSWQALGYDKHSLTTNPMFVSPGTNFALTSSSPAINAGANVGLTADYAGTPIPQGSAPDIGAYEYWVPSSPTSLGQYKSDGVTTIASGGWTNQNSEIFKFNMSSSNSSDSLTPAVEVEPIGTAFTGIANATGSAIAYSGSPVIGSVSVSGLTSGVTYHWQAEVTNSAGVSSWVPMGGSPDFGVDTSPPNTFDLSAPANNTWSTSTSPTFTWNASGDSGSGLAKYQLYVDGTLNRDNIPSSSTSTTPSSALSQGSHTWYIVAVDNVGNSKQSTSTWTTDIDSIAPSTPGTPIFTSPTSNNKPAGYWPSSTDSGSGISYYTFNWCLNSSFTGCSANTATASNNSYSFPNSLADGTWYFRVSATDVAGNTSSYSNYESVLIDTTPPSSFSLNSPSLNSWVDSATPTLSWGTSTDSGSGIAKYKLYIDGNLNRDNLNSTSTTPAQALAEGQHSWYMIVYDNTGNYTQSSTSYFNVDVTPPYTSDSGVSSSWYDSPVTITLYPYDSGSGVVATYYTTNGSTPTTSSPEGTSISINQDGIYTIKYFSVDLAGNVEAVETEANQVKLDTTPPTTPGNPITVSPTNSTTQNWTWTASTDTGSGLLGYEWIVFSTQDDHTLLYHEMATSPQATTNLTNGTYDFEVAAIDNAINFSGIGYGSVTVDTIPPDAPLISESTGTYNSAQTISLTPASDAASTYYTIDGSTPDNTKTPYSGPITISGTDGSTVTLKAVSYDSAGNESSISSASYIFDLSPIVISGVSDGGQYNTTKTVTFNKGTATLNGSSFTNGTTITADGSYTLVVSDAISTVTDKFVIDTTGPIFNTIPSSSYQINVTEGQTVTTNPYIIQVKPSDLIGITNVDFYIDNILICTDTTPNSAGLYECAWDTSKYHSDIKVIVTNSLGNTATLTRDTTVTVPLASASKASTNNSSSSSSNSSASTTTTNSNEPSSTPNSTNNTQPVATTINSTASLVSNTKSSYKYYYLLLLLFIPILLVTWLIKRNHSKV